MKTKTCCAFVFLLIGNIVFAQEYSKDKLSDTTGYWNLSLSMGATGDISYRPNTGKTNTGYNYTIDASFTPGNRIGFFLNYSAAKFNKKGRLYYYPESELNYYNQFTIGPRFYSKSRNSFIDAGIGYYDINGIKSAGGNLGVGGKFRLSDSYAILLGGRLNFVEIFQRSDIFYGIYTGIELNNKTQNTPGDNNNVNYFSVEALGGSYGYGSRSSPVLSYCADLSYPVSKRVSLLISYLHGYSEINNDISYSWNKTEDAVTAGVRIYVTGNNLKLFFEGLTGKYTTRLTEKFYDSEYISSLNSNNNYYGFTIGGGIEFKLIDDLSGIFKINSSSYIMGSNNLGLFGGLKYRI